MQSRALVRPERQRPNAAEPFGYNAGRDIYSLAVKLEMLQLGKLAKRCDKYLDQHRMTAQLPKAYKYNLLNQGIHSHPKPKLSNLAS
jgi:hypothetical protein